MAVKYPTKREAKKLGEPDFQETFTSHQVESPVAEYRISPPSIIATLDHWISVLRGLGIKTSTQADSALAQIREALRVGVPRGAFESLRSDLGISSEEFAGVLGIPMRTLARRTDRFKPDESERLLRVGSVLKKAQNALEDKEAVRRWMTQPKRALGGLTPLVCCDSEVGAREVEALLGRIEHGVFS
jgi:putative toxin-antitoxin system antitoxin component (TIGR02293 family)